MKQQLILSIKQSQQFFQNQCKICFLTYNDSDRFPMLACEAHHLLCQQCFESIKRKDKKDIKCPFCQRATAVSRVQKFKYALVANHLYAQIKAKYYQLADLLDRTLALKEKESGELQQLLGMKEFSSEHKLSLAQMNALVVSLRQELCEIKKEYYKVDQWAQMAKKRQSALQQQLKFCKFKIGILQDKCTMIDSQLEEARRQYEGSIAMLMKDKQYLSQLKKAQNGTIVQLIKDNHALFKENQQMRGQLCVAPKIEFIRSEIPDIFQENDQDKENRDEYMQCQNKLKLRY